MTPSCWTTAPSSICSQRWRSSARVMTCLPRMIDRDMAQPLLNPRALPIVGNRRIGIAIAVIECLDMREDRLGQKSPLDFLAAERPLHDLRQLAQRGIAVEPGEVAVLVEDLAGGHHRLDAIGL